MLSGPGLASPLCGVALWMNAVAVAKPGIEWLSLLRSTAQNEQGMLSFA